MFYYKLINGFKDLSVWSTSDEAKSDMHMNKRHNYIIIRKIVP